MELTYGTLIKVIAGFYLGCTGNIVDKGFYENDYILNLNCKYKTLEKTEVEKTLNDIKLNIFQVEVIK